MFIQKMSNLLFTLTVFWSTPFGPNVKKLFPSDKLFNNPECLPRSSLLSLVRNMARSEAPEMCFTWVGSDLTGKPFLAYYRH